MFNQHKLLLNSIHGKIAERSNLEKYKKKKVVLDSTELNIVNNFLHISNKVIKLKQQQLDFLMKNHKHYQIELILKPNQNKNWIYIIDYLKLKFTKTGEK